MDIVPYGRQTITLEDVLSVSAVLQSEWLTTGPAVEAFENAISRVTGGSHCISVSSGTAALQTAYVAAGITSGDEVITPPLTFIATQAALVHIGAHPVYADVSEDTGNIDPDAVEAAITERTSAIVAVDYAGHPADLALLRKIADRHGLLLIEDASHSLGSSLGGTPVGSIADVTTFSFFPTKNITTAEGGAVVTSDAEVAKKARLYSRQGLIRNHCDFLLPPDGPWHQEVHELGHNFRLSDVQAALGTSQLRRLGDFRRARLTIKEYYDAIFSSVDELRIPHQREATDVMWHLYPLRVPPERRLQVFQYLRRQGVGVQVNYLPAYRHPALARRMTSIPVCPNAEAYYAGEISLPIWPGLTEEQLESISGSVLRAIDEARTG